MKEKDIASKFSFGEGDVLAPFSTCQVGSGPTQASWRHKANCKVKYNETTHLKLEKSHVAMSSALRLLLVS